MTAEIALVNMPFFSISRPSLGLSLLRAGSPKKALAAVEGVAEISAGEQQELIDYLETHRLVWRENQNVLSLAVPLGFSFKPANRHLERLSAVIASLN